MVITLFLFSCGNENNVDHKKLLEQAYKFNDINTAIIAAQCLYLENPENNNYALDTLVNLYDIKKAYFTISKLYEKEAGKITKYSTLMHVALAQNSIGRISESIATLEQMKKKFPEKELHINYELARGQYAKKEKEKCIILLEKILTDPKANQEKISIFFGGNQYQNIDYLSAANNMMGIIFLEEKKWDQAESYFKKALEGNPKFQLAKNNYELLKKAKEKEISN